MSSIWSESPKLHTSDPAEFHSLHVSAANDLLGWTSWRNSALGVLCNARLSNVSSAHVMPSLCNYHRLDRRSRNQGRYRHRAVDPGICVLYNMVSMSERITEAGTKLTSKLHLSGLTEHKE